MSITRISKKFTALAVLPFAAALTLSACGAKTAETTFTLEEDGVDVTMTFTHEGDEVLQETSKHVVDYDVMGVADKEEAEALMDEMFGDVRDPEGYESSIEYGETSATEEINIDYEVADLSKLEELGLIPGGQNLSDDDYISLKETREYIESQGYSEVK